MKKQTAIQPQFNAIQAIYSLRKILVYLDSLTMLNTFIQSIRLMKEFPIIFPLIMEIKQKLN